MEQVFRAVEEQIANDPRVQTPWGQETLAALEQVFDGGAPDGTHLNQSLDSLMESIHAEVQAMTTEQQAPPEHLPLQAVPDIQEVAAPDVGDPPEESVRTSPSREVTAAAPAAAAIDLSREQQQIFEGFRERYAEPVRSDPEQGFSKDLIKALKDAAIAFNEEGGCQSSEEAEQLLHSILKRDNWVRSIVGGALMVGPGYSAGMWSMMRGVMPKLEGSMPPALAGFIGGWMVSSIDKIISSGVMAVQLRNMYSGGPSKNVPELAARRPTLNRIAFTSGAVAGIGTFLKNLSLRGAATQLVASGPKPVNQTLVELMDLLADTAGSFFSGGIGRYISHWLLNGRHEALSFLCQQDVAQKIRAFTGSTPSQSLGRAIVENAQAFVKAAGKSTTMPSSYIAGTYCALLMSALSSTHDYITRNSGRAGEFEGRWPQFQHTLASSGLMGTLVSGAVTIGILGVMDQYRGKLLAKLEQAFSKAAPSGQAAQATQPGQPPESARSAPAAGTEGGTATIEEVPDDAYQVPGAFPMMPIGTTANR